MPESIPAPLIIDTLKDTFREARAALAAEVAEPPMHSHLGWIISVPARPRTRRPRSRPGSTSAGSPSC